MVIFLYNAQIVYYFIDQPATLKENYKNIERSCNIKILYNFHDNLYTCRNICYHNIGGNV